MASNAMTELYEEVVVLGQPMLFTCFRIGRETVPDGFYMYEVRHDDEHRGEPVEIAEHVLVDHFGTLISDAPVWLEPNADGSNAYRDIEPGEDWSCDGTTCTLDQYIHGRGL